MPMPPLCGGQNTMLAIFAPAKRSVCSGPGRLETTAPALRQMRSTSWRSTRPGSSPATASPKKSACASPETLRRAMRRATSARRSRGAAMPSGSPISTRPKRLLSRASERLRRLTGTAMQSSSAAPSPQPRRCRAKAPASAVSTRSLYLQPSACAAWRIRAVRGSAVLQATSRRPLSGTSSAAGRSPRRASIRTSSRRSRPTPRAWASRLSGSRAQSPRKPRRCSSEASIACSRSITPASGPGCRAAATAVRPIAPSCTPSRSCMKPTPSPIA